MLFLFFCLHTKINGVLKVGRWRIFYTFFLLQNIVVFFCPEKDRKKKRSKVGASPGVPTTVASKSCVIYLELFNFLFLFSNDIIEKVWRWCVAGCVRICSSASLDYRDLFLDVNLFFLRYKLLVFLPKFVFSYMNLLILEKLIFCAEVCFSLQKFSFTRES